VSPGEPVGTACPLCGEEARALLGDDDQAFCFNLECDIFTWNPKLSRDELASGLKVIDLSFLEDR